VDHWIINLIPPIIDAGYSFRTYGSEKGGCSNIPEGFLFGGLSPPNEKTISLRPSRLCGENSNLDRTDVESKSLLRLFALPISDILL
jgi:hypothetical protein